MNIQITTTNTDGPVPIHILSPASLVNRLFFLPGDHEEGNPLLVPGVPEGGPVPPAQPVSDPTPPEEVSDDDEENIPDDEDDEYDVEFEEDEDEDDNE